MTSFILVKNLCVARNSIWRRRHKEFCYHFAVDSKREFEGYFDELTALEQRNFWDIDKYIHGKKLRLFTTGYDFITFVEPLIRKDSMEHNFVKSYFW